MTTCGVGGWGGPLPGDPSNDVVLSAVAAYGGIDVSWSYPTTNPFAVAYVKVFRSLTNNVAASVKVAEVGGDRYFDKFPTVTTAYYWIQLISRNGTVLALVGPDSATSMLEINRLIAELSGKIDDGLLATILRTKVDRIPLLETNLAAEIAARIADNSSLAAVLADMVTDINGVGTAIVSETTTRTTQNSALVTSLDALAVTVNGNTAAIITETSARATADGALASRVEILEAMGGGGGGDFAAGIEIERLARVAADLAVTSSLEALVATRTSETAANLAAAIATESTARVTGDTAVASSVTALQATLNTKIGVDIAAAIASERTVRVTAEGALGTRIDTTQASITTLSGTLAGLISAEATTRATNDGVLASSITTAQATLGTSIASVRTDMTADIAVVDGKATAIGSRWTAVVDVNGLVGGFGVYNDGSTIQAGFNVDTFWVGKNTDKIKPFIITGGVVYINEAAIGQLSANAINTNGLTVRNGAGQIILGAGATVDPSAFMAVPSGWLNSNAIATAAADATTKANVAQAAAIASSVAGLALKLNNSSASTLSAVLSLDATSVSGLRVGNLTWNTAGARIGGYGVAVTPFGLVGVNPAGNTTFSLNAATGSLVLQGDISGSTGNFVGSISVNGATWSNGTTGFFAGIDSGYARLRIGSSVQYMSYDQFTGKLELKLDSFTVTPSVSFRSYNQLGYPFVYAPAAITTTVVGGTGTKKYQWSLVVWNINNTASLVMTSDPTGSTFAFRANIDSAGASVDGTATCTVTDENGRVTTASIAIHVEESA